MRVLLTNDDGIHAPGLWALHHAFAPRHQVVVVAPDRERSAVGHAITLHQPIRSHSLRVNANGEGFAVSGTPADCVKLGLAELVQARPDLVVAGINPGANVGVNLSYSGTVAAAKEAAMAGIPSLAVSIAGSGEGHLADVAAFVESLACQLLTWRLPAGTFLNVNFPDLPRAEIRGVRWSRQGAVGAAQQFEKRLDPRNRPYYWQGGEGPPAPAAADIDRAALAERWVSITPITCDMTDYAALRELSQREIALND